MDRFKPNKSNYQFTMSRAEIGNYLGLTSETVTRTLTMLKNDAIISCFNAFNII